MSIDVRLIGPTARLRAKVRAVTREHGPAFFAPPTINKRLHFTKHGCHVPRTAAFRGHPS